MKPTNHPFSSHADRLGVLASAACMAHCILTPVILSLSAVWAHLLPSEEIVHQTLAIVVSFIGAFALFNGYRRHRRGRVIVLMGLGLTSIVASGFLGDRLPSHAAEMLLTLIGSLLMIAAHLVNHTFCRSCNRCDTR